MKRPLKAWIFPLVLLMVALWSLRHLLFSGAVEPSSKVQEAGAEFVDIRATKAIEGPPVSHLWNRLEALGLGRDPAQWVEKIVNADPEQRMRLLMEISDTCYRSPSEFAGPACEFARLWFNHQPGDSLRFLSMLQGIKEVTPIERDLTQKWVQQDFEDATGYLEKIFSEENVDSTRQLAMMASVCQFEEPNNLSLMVDWVRSLADDDNPDLYKGAAQALVETSEPGRFQEISGVLDTDSSDPYMGSLVSALVCRHAEVIPDEVMQFAEGVGNPELRASLAENLFCEWSISDRGRALQFASDSSLARFAGDTGTEEERHDLILARLAANAHVADVELLKELAKRAHDPDLRAQIEAIAMQRFEAVESR